MLQRLRYHLEIRKKYLLLQADKLQQETLNYIGITQHKNAAQLHTFPHCSTWWQPPTPCLLLLAIKYNGELWVASE